MRPQKLYYDEGLIIDLVGTEMLASHTSSPIQTSVVTIRRVNTSETDEECLGKSSADLLKISLLKVVLCDICTVS